MCDVKLIKIVKTYTDNRNKKSRVVLKVWARKTRSVFTRRKGILSGCFVLDLFSCLSNTISVKNFF